MGQLSKFSGSTFMERLSIEYKKSKETFAPEDFLSFRRIETNSLLFAMDFILVIHFIGIFVFPMNLLERDKKVGAILPNEGQRAILLSIYFLNQAYRYILSRKYFHIHRRFGRIAFHPHLIQIKK